mgnify:CR=1 FL=1
MNMMNKKAVSTPLVLIIIVVMVIAVLAVAFSMGTAPSTNNSDVKVYIDTVEQTGNYTDPQTLTWANSQAGNTYTKNFTAMNNGVTPYYLTLYTTEPAGTTHAWSYNNTQLAPATSAQGTLSFTLSNMPATGLYTWRLFASNSTLNPVVTPTPTPTIAPVINLQFTITSEPGAENITAKINTDAIILIPGDFPATFLYKSTDTLTFKTNAATGYTFNTWLIDGMSPKTGVGIENTLVLTDLTGNFTIQAKYLLTP